MEMGRAATEPSGDLALDSSPFLLIEAGPDPQLVVFDRETETFAPDGAPFAYGATRAFHSFGAAEPVQIRTIKACGALHPSPAEKRIAIRQIESRHQSLDEKRDREIRLVCAPVPSRSGRGSNRDLQNPIHDGSS